MRGLAIAGLLVIVAVIILALVRRRGR